MMKRNSNTDGSHYEPPLREWSNIVLPPSQLRNGNSKTTSQKLLGSTSTNASSTECTQKSSCITRLIVLAPLTLLAFVTGGFVYLISKLGLVGLRSIN